MILVDFVSYLTNRDSLFSIDKPIPGANVVHLISQSASNWNPNRRVRRGTRYGYHESSSSNSPESTVRGLAQGLRCNFLRRRMSAKIHEVCRMRRDVPFLLHRRSCSSSVSQTILVSST